MPESHTKKIDISLNTIAGVLFTRIEKYGIASILLFMLLYWAKPHVDEMIKSHGELLENTQVIQIKQADTLETATKTLERIDRNAADTNTIVHELKNK